MKARFAAAFASTVVLSATAAFAGGPVVIGEEDEVIAERPASSVGILPILLVGVVLCAALCGGDDEQQPRLGPSG